MRELGGLSSRHPLKGKISLAMMGNFFLSFGYGLNGRVRLNGVRCLSGDISLVC